jgi:hypothetical protein
MTIFGKLDDAERASEYNNGVETLRRGLTQFDLSLDQNPDWRKYPELAAQKENELWATVDQSTKHQGAKNDLQQTWQQMRDQHLASIGDISNRVRIKTYHADLVKRIDQREKDVEAGTITAAEAAAANEKDLKAASDTSVIDPTAAFTTGQQSRAYMQTAEAGRKIREEARANGWDAAIAKIPQIAGQYSELKSPGEIDRFTQTMQTQRDYSEARQVKQDAIANDKTEEPLAKEFSDVMENDGDPSKLKQLIDKAKGKWVGKEIAARDEKWALRFREIIRTIKSDKKAAEADNPIADGLRIDSQNELIDTGVTLNNAKDALAKKQITWNQYKSVQAALSPRVKSMALPYEAVFKTDVSMEPKVIRAMTLAAASFRSWVGNNMDASEADMKKKSDDLHKDALKGIVRDAASRAFEPGSYSEKVQQAVSDAAAGKPLDIRPIGGGIDAAAGRGFTSDVQSARRNSNVPKALSDRNISVTRSQTKDGTTYYEAADGKTYQIAKSGAILWWDGKTWQTLK